MAVPCNRLSDYLKSGGLSGRRNDGFITQMSIMYQALAWIRIRLLPSVLIKRMYADDSFCHPTKKIILTVAELIPRKNVETSIRAFAKSNRDDAILAICGKGILEPSLKELAQKLQVGDRVFFAGYHTDVLDLYHCADLFLFTSFQEGLSVAVMQAMAAGLPIIASDIRGNRDLLASEPHTRSKHYLLPTKDADAYAAKINKILNDPALAQALGEENQTNCREIF